MEATAELKEVESPPLKIEIFYAPHKTEEDQKGLAKMLEETDIYAPEIPGWKPKELEIFQDVSKGVINPSEGVKCLDRNFSGIRLAEFKALYKSNKPIIFIDVPIDNSIYLRSVEKIERLARLTESAALNNSFKEYIEQIRDVIKSLARTQKDRESYMLLSLEPKVKELLKRYPDLRKKKELKVLLNLGAVHINLYKSLKKNDQEIGRTFNDMPTIFSHTEEGIRKFLFGKDIKGELAAKIFLELLFADELEQWTSESTKNSVEQNKIRRLIFSQVNIQDAEDIFNRVKKGEDPKLLFDSILETKGVQKPKVREDAEKLLVPA